MLIDPVPRHTARVPAGSLGGRPGGGGSGRGWRKGNGVQPFPTAPSRHLDLKPVPSLHVSW